MASTANGDAAAQQAQSGRRARRQAAGAKNVWGTTKSDVGEGYCPDCEREDSPNTGRQHYNNCPTQVAR